MYCNKDNVNILTTLLVKHGVRNVVVCPGSRNSPLVHNFVECPELRCYPVTDERSAGFYALGMCQALNEPVAVCVTSGTALLNVAPAVAEAFYQHQPIIVISADRPTQWIDQLDGQTLHQTDVLNSFVKKKININEPHNEEERWYCNRLINEALVSSMADGCGPIHINVPITEPLFVYDVETLPDERVITMFSPKSTEIDDTVIRQFEKAERPMIVIGQMKKYSLTPSSTRTANGRYDLTNALSPGTAEGLDMLGYVVLQERLSGDGRTAKYLDESVALVKDIQSYLPDFILYIGDTLVSKQTRHFLRKAKNAECWEINPEGRVHDVFMNLTGIICAYPDEVLKQIRRHEDRTFHDLWGNIKRRVHNYQSTFVPAYSQLLAVKRLEEITSQRDSSSIMHYANSGAVRCGNIYSWHYIYCNRGVNGIEGSLSTAAGFSLVTENNVYCVIGDLSFFYDQNALWNKNLKRNFRILLINNSGGGIFRHLEGLSKSQASEDYIMGRHRTTAEGICQENNIIYLKADNEEDLDKSLLQLTCEEYSRPILLEVFTDGETDAKVYNQYYRGLL